MPLRDLEEEGSYIVNDTLRIRIDIRIWRDVSRDGNVGCVNVARRIECLFLRSP